MCGGCLASAVGRPRRTECKSRLSWTIDFRARPLRDLRLHWRAGNAPSALTLDERSATIAITWPLATPSPPDQRSSQRMRAEWPMGVAAAGIDAVTDRYVPGPRR